MNKSRTAVIGCGTMGSIIIEQLLRRRVVNRSSLIGCDSGKPVLENIARRFHIRTVGEVSRAVAGARVIILAVKPQQSLEVFSDARQMLAGDQLVLSIMAGVTTRELRTRLRHQTVVRAMPNIAARVGRSVTAWYAAPRVAARHRRRIEAYLHAFGTTVRVRNERVLDLVTAVSGSGPAYWYYTAELLERAAVVAGMPRQLAQQLVRETYLGAAALVENEPRDFAQLREAVTSKGGTTAAALRILDQRRLGRIWREAVQAAFRRAQALSKHHD